MTSAPEKFELPPNYDPPTSRPGGKTLLLTVAVVIILIAIAYFRSV